MHHNAIGSRKASTASLETKRLKNKRTRMALKSITIIAKLQCTLAFAGESQLHQNGLEKKLHQNNVVLNSERA